MSVKIKQIAKQSAPFLSGGLAILLAAAIISSPESSFHASLQGLQLWWTLVFPALLPFLMLSEMLSASGFVHAVGVLLEPIMKLLFRLPGSAGWTLALGMASGFPGGAQGALQLHRQGEISARDACRLASLAHFASPVTLLIVVGTAMLHSPSAGYGLLAVHWLAGLVAGMTVSAGASHRKDTAPPDAPAKRRASLIRRAVSAALDARARDGRSFGRLLGESVGASVQSLMLAGGYIIIFSVVVNIVARVWPALPAALPASFLEIHLGAKALTSGASFPPAIPGASVGPLGLAVLSGALGWSGISAQLQSLTVLRPAGAHFLPFAGGRLLHGGYAFLLTLLLYKPISAIQETLPAFSGGNFSTLSGSTVEGAVWSFFPNAAALFALTLLALLVLAFAVRLTFALRRHFH